MIRLNVLSTGPMTSVQDAGRVGAQRYGLPPSGAMDPLAMATANALVTNLHSTPAIEIGPLPAVFRIYGGPVRIALAGTPRKIEIGQRAAALDQSLFVGDGELINVGSARGGLFSYLAIAGGIKGEPVFGSFSVTTETGIGSPIARALQAGDEFELHASSAGPDYRVVSNQLFRQTIRIVAGPQAAEFGDDLNRFLASEWQVSSACNRMGYRLNGPRINHSKGHNIVSDGTVNGSIQIPGDGQPIVLMPDRGTTGGYPKIATVITPDIAALAQMQAGRIFHFSEVSIEEAQEIARGYLHLIASLPDRLMPTTQAEVALHTLLDANLAGAAISALDTRTWQATLPRIPDDDQ